MSQSFPNMDLLDEMSYVPDKSKKESVTAPVSMTILEDLDKKPKTIDELMAEMRGEDVEEKIIPVEKKPTQKEIAIGVQQQFQELLKEKDERAISSGMIASMLISLFGVLTAVAMTVSGHFNNIYSVAIMLVSGLFLLKNKTIKGLSYIVFYGNIIFMIIIFVRQIIGKHNSSFLIGLIATAIAIVTNIVVCSILTKNENIEKYYATAKKD